ncbi:hypothetical protein CSPX01_16912 [Colletotrichum filicis]|nr:hypothetical protein CSPX01_16912 [Colletotrichum filicis]
MIIRILEATDLDGVNDALAKSEEDYIVVVGYYLPGLPTFRARSTTATTTNPVPSSKAAPGHLMTSGCHEQHYGPQYQQQPPPAQLPPPVSGSKPFYSFNHKAVVPTPPVPSRRPQAEPAISAPSHNPANPADSLDKERETEASSGDVWLAVCVALTPLVGSLQVAEGERVEGEPLRNPFYIWNLRHVIKNLLSKVRSVLDKNAFPLSPLFFCSMKTPNSRP